MREVASKIKFIVALIKEIVNILHVVKETLPCGVAWVFVHIYYLNETLQSKTPVKVTK